MPEDHTDIRDAIERTRAELSERLDALSAHADLRAKAADTVAEGRKKVKASKKKAAKSARKATRKAKRSLPDPSAVVGDAKARVTGNKRRKRFRTLTALGAAVAAVAVGAKRRTAK